MEQLTQDNQALRTFVNHFQEMYKNVKGHHYDFEELEFLNEKDFYEYLIYTLEYLIHQELDD